MSIKTTHDIPRQSAIERIKEIYITIMKKDYRWLETLSFEPNADIQSFVDEFEDFDIANIEKWTNKMVEDKIDMPFFRYSMFDNYFVKE